MKSLLFSQDPNTSSKVLFIKENVHISHMKYSKPTFDTCLGLWNNSDINAEKDKQDPTIFTKKTGLI